VPEGGYLLWDGNCALCARCVGIVRRVARRPVDLRPFQQEPGLPAAVRERLRYEMVWAHANGEYSGGAKALVHLIREAGYGWIARALALPGVFWMVDRVYRWVARNRGPVCSTGAT